MHDQRWRGVQLRDLIALQVVAEEGSFVAAARRLAYTQPAVSGQIRALERCVGVRVIERVRGSRSVAPTEAGRILIRHAAAITGRLAAACAEIESLQDGPTLRIGSFRELSISLLPEILASAAVERVDVRVGADVGAVVNGELDAAFTVGVPAEGALVADVVLTDRYVVLVRRRDPLADRAVVHADDVAGRPLVAPPASRYQVAVETMLGLEPALTRRVDDCGHVAGFVAAGLGYGLVPALGLTLPPQLVALVLDEAAAARPIAFVRRRGAELPGAFEAAVFAVCRRHSAGALRAAG